MLENSTLWGTEASVPWRAEYPLITAVCRGKILALVEPVLRTLLWLVPGFGDGAPMTSQAVPMPAAALTDSDQKGRKLFSFLFCAQHNLGDGKDLQDHIPGQAGNWIYRPWILPFLSSLYLRSPQTEAAWKAIKVIEK